MCVAVWAYIRIDTYRHIDVFRGGSKCKPEVNPLGFKNALNFFFSYINYIFLSIIDAELLLQGSICVFDTVG